MGGELKRIPFEDAMAETAGMRRHLLLGNGFSISAHEGFRYGSLIAKAGEVDPVLPSLFAKLGAYDFEHAMRLVADPAASARLREGLIRSISATHPAPGEIGHQAREACAHFLSQFLRKTDDPLRGIVFTTNYDLILYWILVQFSRGLDCWDGFDSDFVWASSARIAGSNVLYLHGGMHIFERPMGTKSRIVKIAADRNAAGRRLRDVIRDHLDAGELPVFISEGTAGEKQHKIRQNEYLSAAFRKFGRICQEVEAALFTVGHGLTDVDRHLTDKIGQGAINAVYLGLFSDDDERRASRLVADWQTLRAESGLAPLCVKTFRTQECGIWNPGSYPPLEPARRRLLNFRP